MDKKKQPITIPEAPVATDITMVVAAPPPPGQVEVLSGKASSTGSAYPIGTLINGQYEVLESLGCGGMGTVLKCTDKPTNRTVAVKILRHELVLDTKAMQRFQREAQAIAALEHPNLVKLHSFHADVDSPMLVMEYIDGIPLSKEIEDHGALDTKRAIEIACSICDALEYTHTKGIIHRDLKPSNIIISKRSDGSDAVKVVDFGIAKINDAQNKVTSTGEIFGSPSYMSPEQALGQVVAESADQYALGCMLFECLTGSVPFISDNALAVMMHHLREEPPSLKKASLGKEFPSDLESTVRRMLAKDPTHRFPSMRAVRDALKGKFREAYRPALVGDKQSKPHSPLMFALLGSGLTIVSIALAVSVWFLWQGEQPMATSSSSTLSVAGGKTTFESNSSNSSKSSKSPNASEPEVNGSAPPQTQSPDDSFEAAQLSRFLSQCANNSSLDLSSLRRGLSPKAVAQLSAMSNLRQLRMQEMHNTKLLNNLSSTTLTELDLSGSDVKDETILALRSLPNLRSINLTGCFLLTDAGFADVGKLKSLRTVILEHNNISNKGLEGLLKLPALEELYFNKNKNLTGDWLKPISKVPTLVRLDLVKQPPEGNLIYLQHLHNLRFLSIPNSDLTQKDVDHLMKLKTLTTLVLASSSVTDAQYLALVHNLPNLEAASPPSISAATKKETEQILTKRRNARMKH